MMKQNIGGSRRGIGLKRPDDGVRSCAVGDDDCYTVPAVPGRPLRREPFYLFRETIAFPYYLIFRQ